MAARLWPRRRRGAAQPRGQAARGRGAQNLRYRRLAPLKGELEALEREIDALGGELRALETAMADPEFYKEGARFAETFRRHRELTARRR